MISLAVSGDLPDEGGSSDGIIAARQRVRNMAAVATIGQSPRLPDLDLPVSRGIDRSAPVVG